jgi:hypothetical protein
MISAVVQYNSESSMMDDDKRIIKNLAGNGCSLHLPKEIEVSMKKPKFFIWKYTD